LKRTSNYVFKKNLTTTLTYEESEKSWELLFLTKCQLLLLQRAWMLNFYPTALFIFVCIAYACIPFFLPF
jgi:hypothetical protein